MKKILIVFLLAINSLFIANSALAERFDIQNYDVNIEVSNDKTYTITESINTYFHESAHGIFRSIPIKHNENIEILNANEKYATNMENGKLKIQLGSARLFVRGDKNYTITYKYQIKDHKNEFYYNIIGPEWDTTIHNASFKIVMPYDVDPEKVGISIGKYGTKGFKGIARYKVDGNVITGYMLEQLPPNHGITVRIEVPKGYFSFPNQTFWEKHQQDILIAIILLLTLLSVHIWHKYGKDDLITPIVTFYPPKDLSCAKVGFIYNELANTDHIISLIYSLAANGYIQIINEDQIGFKIIKLKEYDGTDEIQARVMEALFTANKNLHSSFHLGYNSSKEELFFESSNLKQTKILGMNITYSTDDVSTFDNNVSENNIVTARELKHSKTFYKDMLKLQGKLNTACKSFFTNASTSFLPGFLITLSAFTIPFLLWGPSIDFEYSRVFSEDKTAELGLLMTVFSIVSMSSLIFFPKSPKFTEKLMMPIFPIAAIGILYYLANTYNYLPLAIIGVICGIIISICLKNIKRWTVEGKQLKSEVLGFRKFLQISEKHQLEYLIRENPNYCYDLIPYAFALGITDSWIKKLEDIAMTDPSWYSGAFNVRAFKRVSTGLHDSATPSTDNGGQSKGRGGSVGGGRGGGGGGSW